jgi:hypothetical protein
MNDIGIHVLLFVVVGFVIVVISAMFSEPDDAKALRVIPRRLAYFFSGCTAVALVMLLLEYTLASVN